MSHYKTINAIDIGTSKITTIIAQIDEDDDKINVIAVSSQDASGFRKGQIIDPQKATDSIEKSIESAERMAGFQIDNISVTFADPHIESANSHGVIATNSGSSEINSSDVDRAIEASKAIPLPQGKEIIHYIPRKFSIDGQDDIMNPIGMNGNRLEVDTHILFASSPSLKNLKKCFEEIGIKINQIIYSGIASSQSVLNDSEKELGVALIDIGGNITTLTVYYESAPIYAAVIPVGANNITNDLAIGLRLSLPDANNFKHRLEQVVSSKKFDDEIELSQLEISDSENKKISISTATNGIIKPRLEEIFSMILEKINSNSLLNNIPAGIVLTGGGSQTINVKEICSSVIPLPVRIASPPKVNGIVDEITNPSFSSTIGIIMYIQSQKPNQKKSTKKSSSSFSSITDKIKNLLEPLLP